MSILERRLPKPSEQSYFLQFAKDITSQGGEDGILEEIFRLLSSHPSLSFPKFCVDIGAWDGEHLSNTYHLLNDCEWSGLLVEADQSRFERLSTLYAQRPDVLCAAHLVDIEGEHSLLNLLQKHRVPTDAGFLCIDVDGADFHLWRSIAPTYRPVVVCIEFNPTIPNNVYFVQAPRIEVQQGSSLLAIKELGEELGYVLVVTTTFNAIFVRSDFAECLPMNEIPRTIHQMHVPFMATEMFQTYDGELKFVGTKKLLWHKVALNPQKLQMLSKKERKYPFSPGGVIEKHEKTIEKLSDNFKAAVSIDSEESTTAAVSALSSLLDLSQLTSLETLVEERLNRTLCFWISLRERGLGKTRWVAIVEILAEHATRCIASDLIQARRFFCLSAETADALQRANVSHDIVDDASEELSLLAKVRLGMVRCQRLLGELLAARQNLRLVEQSLSTTEDKLREEFEKEKKKIDFLISIGST